MQNPEPDFSAIGMILVALLIVTEPGSIRTQGLMSSYGHKELVLPYSSSHLKNAAVQMCELLLTYVEGSGRRFSAGEKIGWASSVVQLREEGDMLVGYGLDVASDEFNRGIDNVLSMWMDQRAMCDLNGSEYVATNLADMIVVSPDLLTDDGEVVEAIRYPFRNPNAGWWMFGKLYSGDVTSLKRIHAGHIVQRYEHVLSYLALKPGYCFRLSDDLAVWFDDEVSGEEPI